MKKKIDCYSSDDLDAAKARVLAGIERVFLQQLAKPDSLLLVKLEKKAFSFEGQNVKKISNIGV